MPRIRSIKPEAFQSESLAAVSLAAERTFFGLSTQVDDHGRITDKAAVLNGAIWSVRSELRPHAVGDFENELRELVKEDLICRFVGCDGKKYLHLVTWKSHQKVDHPGKPRIPRCPIHSVDEECGVHGARPCPPPIGPSRDSREDSRESREPSRLGGSGQNAQSGHGPIREDLGESRETLASAGEDLAQPVDLQEFRSSRESRETSESLALGSRISDLGSIKALADDTPNAQLSLIPDLAPASPSQRAGKPPTVNQRVDKLAKVYAGKVPLSSIFAIKAVVKIAVQAKGDTGELLYSDLQIENGLLFLAENKWTLKASNLCRAIEGPPVIPSQRPSVDQRVFGTLQTAEALARRLGELPAEPADGFTAITNMPSRGFAS